MEYSFILGAVITNDPADLLAAGCNPQVTFAMLERFLLSLEYEDRVVISPTNVPEIGCVERIRNLWAYYLFAQEGLRHDFPDGWVQMLQVAPDGHVYPFDEEDSE